VSAFQRIPYDLGCLPRIVGGAARDAELFKEAQRLEHLLEGLSVVELQVSDVKDADRAALATDHLIELQPLLTDPCSR
jgi:hypothetical protein